MQTNSFSPGLFTDLYQLTMAYAYWKSGTHDKEAVFSLFFRRHPFAGGFTVACGLDDVISYLQSFRFEGSDLQYLETLIGNDGKRLFEPAFLDYLSNLTFQCDVDAIPEGTVVFPQEPLLRVQGLVSWSRHPCSISSTSRRSSQPKPHESALQRKATR